MVIELERLFEIHVESRIDTTNLGTVDKMAAFIFDKRASGGRQSI
jgi:hypothetical protein